MRRIELLAPARDLLTGIEAIKHGADAVYIGAPKFGARAAAGNSIEDIGKLVAFARPYGVKVYVTLNTLLRDEELKEARQMACELQEAGVDALIVQDLSLVRSYELEVTNSQLTTQDSKLKTQNLKYHASTQMDNQTAEKVEWLWKMGFRQTVLARELTLDEIREIHKRVPQMALEVFVHGAICVCYNGRCFASEHCFGRSANRGECAQFCRMPFDLIEEQRTGGKERVILKQKHLLSLRDMNRSDDLEALLDAGVSSLKIEGRLKDTAYVKNVVAYYRQKLNEIFRRRPEYRRSSLGHETITFTPNPAKSFNRLFTDYFLHGRTPDMANIHTPKSMGEPIGSAEIKNFWKSPSPIHNGDGLCYVNKEGELVGFRLNRVSDLQTLPISQYRLFRNLDQQFNQALSKPTATRKMDVSWLLKSTEEGFLLRLGLEDGTFEEQVFTYPHELARSPQTEPITRQLSRLGDTPYEATAVSIELADNYFIPSSVLAEWRRTLTEKLLATKKEEDVRGEGHTDRIPEEDFSNLIERQRHPDEPGLLMICRYCIRYELGMCNKNKRVNGGSSTHAGQENVKAKNDDGHSPLVEEGKGELFLRLRDGRRFRLHFDCKRCRMKVYAI